MKLTAVVKAFIWYWGNYIGREAIYPVSSDFMRSSMNDNEMVLPEIGVTGHGYHVLHVRTYKEKWTHFTKLLLPCIALFSPSVPCNLHFFFLPLSLSLSFIFVEISDVFRHLNLLSLLSARDREHLQGLFQRGVVSCSAFTLC